MLLKGVFLVLLEDAGHGELLWQRLKGKLAEHPECLLYLGTLEPRAWGKSLCAAIFFRKCNPFWRKEKQEWGEREWGRERRWSPCKGAFPSWPLFANKCSWLIDPVKLSLKRLAWCVDYGISGQSVPRKGREGFSPELLRLVSERFPRGAWTPQLFQILHVGAAGEAHDLSHLKSKREAKSRRQEASSLGRRKGTAGYAWVKLSPYILGYPHGS